MSRYMENFCVGCPQGCIHCQYYNDILVIECDRCGYSDFTADEAKEGWGFEDLCPSCFRSLEEQEEQGFFDRCDGCEYIEEVKGEYRCTKYNANCLDILDECEVYDL